MPTQIPSTTTEHQIKPTWANSVWTTVSRRFLSVGDSIVIGLSKSALIALFRSSMRSTGRSPYGPAALFRIGVTIGAVVLSIQGHLLYVSIVFVIMTQIQSVLHWWRWMYPTKNYPDPTKEAGGDWFSTAYTLKGSQLLPDLERTVPGRGFSTHGSYLIDFLKTNVHMRFEYAASITRRCAKRDLRHLYRFVLNRQHPKCTHESCYHAAINTSFAAFIDASDINRATFIGINLPRVGGQPSWHGDLTFHFDHALWQVTSADVKADGAETIHVDDPSEICVLMLLVVSVFTHVVGTHWPANGVLDVEKFWPLARQSNSFVQWFNYHAVNSSGYAFAAPMVSMQHTLMTNFQRGFPMHHHLGPIASRSKVHTMGAKARADFAKRWPTCPPGAIMSFLTATLYHSADHYYGDQLHEDVGECTSLQADFSLLRLCSVPPNYSFVRKTLCRQRQHEDAACKVLYDIAAAVDKDFADNGLFIGPVS